MRPPRRSRLALRARRHRPLRPLTRAVPPDLIAWVKSTQPQAWETLEAHHGGATEATLLDRVRKQVEQRGVLDVLRNGVDGYPLKHTLSLAQFKPAFGINDDLMARYHANRLRVVRQVRYSTANQNCIDLILFLNGLPVATCELKTDFTQSVQDAVDQYRFDRLPKAKGQAAEPLLSFPYRGAGPLRRQQQRGLHGRATRRPRDGLPALQQGRQRRWQPAEPEGTSPTSYLWEEVWERESWFDIVGRYIVAKRNSKKQLEGLIFPRFHQLDVTRKLPAKVLEEGPGTKFLIQHSAGSGKTNSIAWTAHFLADLHDAARQEGLFRRHRRVRPQCDQSAIAGDVAGVRAQQGRRRQHHQ